MKYFVILGALALAACSDAEVEEPVAEETVAAVPFGMMAADGIAPEGTYEITDQDGGVTTQVVMADGSYTSTDAEGTESAGTWRLEEPDLWCQTETGETEENCYRETLEDGVWTSVDVDDPEDSSTIVRQ